MLCPYKPLHTPVVCPLTGKYALNTLPWNTAENSANEGLCLLLHGMHASQKQWENYSRQFSHSFPHFHLVVGSVHKAGNCPVQVAGEPFIEIVEDYLKRVPDKPVILMGTSNGSRIVSDIETRVNPELLKNRKLIVISIAGVHGGTSMMDLACKFFCTRILKYSPGVTKELVFNSKTSQDLLFSLQARQKTWKAQGTEAHHFFFATTEDQVIRPLESNFPYLEFTPLKNYKIVHKENHQTIVDRVQEQIFQIMKEQL